MISVTILHLKLLVKYWNLVLYKICCKMIFVVIIQYYLKVILKNMEEILLNLGTNQESKNNANYININWI
jgi:hypothetical protein